MTTLLAAAARFVQTRFPAGSRERLVVAASAAQLGVAGVSALLAVVAQLVIARMIGADEFGRYAYVLSWVNVIALAGALGFDTASLRFVAEYRTLGQWARLRGYLLTTVALSAAVASLLAIIGAALQWRNSQFADASRSVIVGGAVLLPTLVLLKVTGSHLQAMQRALASAASQGIVRPLALFVVLGVLLQLRATSIGAGTVMIANLVATAMALVLCVVLTRTSLSHVTAAAKPEYRTREWITTAAPLLAITVSQGLLLSADVLMIGAYRGTTEAGLYSVAAQLVTVITLAINAANAIVAPLLAELYAKRDLQGMRDVLRISARSVLAYAIPVLLVLIVFGERLLALYGAEFRDSWLPMMILAVGQISIVAFGSVGFLLTMSGNERVASRAIVASAVLNVVLNAVFIPLWGVVGAAVATGVSTFARSAILTVASRRLLGITATAL